MKKILLLLFILTPILGFGQYTAIPDENFQNFLEENYGVEIYNINNIPSVLNTDINDISSMNLSSSGIASLEGISGFYALEVLIVNSNSLTTIDLSQNIFLSQLQCNDNNLTEINVTGNLFLEHLDFAFNNMVSIDLSNNPFLYLLNGTGNSLTSLDLSENSNLEYLLINDNNFFDIDVTNNPGLLSLEINDNFLFNIDLSQNTELSSLQIINNYLQELNLSLNIELELLYCQDNIVECIQVSNPEGYNNSNNFIKDGEDVWSDDCGYETISNGGCDTVYVDVVEYITDTIVEIVYENYYIYDTIVEAEFVDVIITEYVDCDTGLPCESGIFEILDKSKTDGNLYNLLGQEINRREGIYIEDGEVKYRF